MKIAGLYDALATQYNKTCSYGIINDAQMTTLRHIQKHIGSDAALEVLDVGVGSADFFKKLSPHYPYAKLYGLDLSEKMLKLAQEKIAFEAVIGSVQELEKYYKDASKDIIAAHFISAYVPAVEIFKKCSATLKPGGYMSFLTTTYESFKHLQSDVEGMEHSYNPISQFIYVMVNKGLKKTQCPKNLDELKKAAAEAGLEIVESQQLLTKMVFADEHEALRFVYNDGWGVNVANVPLIPFKLARFLTLVFLKKFKYPFEDAIVIDALLLKKPDNSRSPT